MITPISKAVGGFVGMMAYLIAAIFGMTIGAALICAAHALGAKAGGKVVDVIHKSSVSISRACGEAAEAYVILCGRYPILGIVTVALLTVAAVAARYKI